MIVTMKKNSNDKVIITTMTTSIVIGMISMITNSPVNYSLLVQMLQGENYFRQVETEKRQ